MTNQERAQQIIAKWIDDNLPYSEENDWADEAIAEALADDGVLMPDLPEPEMHNGQKVWRVNKDGFVYIKPSGWIATVGVATPYDSPRIAYLHALAIIAATNAAELLKEDNND